MLQGQAQQQENMQPDEPFSWQGAKQAAEAGFHLLLASPQPQQQQASNLVHRDHAAAMLCITCGRGRQAHGQLAASQGGVTHIASRHGLAAYKLVLESLLYNVQAGAVNQYYRQSFLTCFAPLLQEGRRHSRHKPAGRGGAPGDTEVPTAFIMAQDDPVPHQAQQAMDTGGCCAAEGRDAAARAETGMSAVYCFSVAADSAEQFSGG